MKLFKEWKKEGKTFDWLCLISLERWGIGISIEHVEGRYNFVLRIVLVTLRMTYFAPRYYDDDLEY